MERRRIRVEHLHPADDPLPRVAQHDPVTGDQRQRLVEGESRVLIAERTQAGLAAARARGRMGGRPRKMDKATLAMAMAAMSDRNAVAADVARRLGMTTTTLYMYVNGDGTPKAPGQALLDGVPYRKERLRAA